MIVVMPNGRAMKDDRPGDHIFDEEKIKAFSDFENDLLTDLIPFIEANYPVIPTGITVPWPDYQWEAGRR